MTGGDRAVGRKVDHVGVDPAIDPGCEARADIPSEHRIADQDERAAGTLGDRFQRVDGAVDEALVVGDVNLVDRLLLEVSAASAAPAPATTRVHLAAEFVGERAPLRHRFERDAAHDTVLVSDVRDDVLASTGICVLVQEFDDDACAVGRRRRRLDGPARTGADATLISFAFAPSVSDGDREPRSEAASCLISFSGAMMPLSDG